MKSPAQAVGNRTPVLRETRMPAVQIQLGPAALVSVSLAAIATALTHSLERWFVEPLDEGKSLAEDRPKP